MKATRLIIAALVFVALLAGAAFMYGNDDAGTDAANQAPAATSSGTSGDESNAGTSEKAEVAATITFDGNSFSPEAVTIKAGQQVRVTNTSQRTIDFASDPHPQHTENTELNSGILTPGQSKTFVIEKQGTWDYHDHLNASRTGTIIAE